MAAENIVGDLLERLAYIGESASGTGFHHRC